MSEPVAAYYRASTREQGKSGLGLTPSGCGTSPEVVRALRVLRRRAMMMRVEDPGAVHRPTKIDFTYSS